MAKVNIKVLCRNFVKSDGSHQLALRVIIGRKTKYFPVGFDVLPNDFDPDKELVRRTDPRNHEKNLAISNLKSKALNIENYFLAKKLRPEMKDFTRRFLGDSANQDSFYQFAEMHLKRNQHKFAEGTRRFYRKHIGKLKKFAPDLTFGDIDLNFLSDYENHCRNLNNNENTTNKSLEFIRRIVNAAIKQDVIEKSPFRNYPIKNIPGKTDTLNLSEIRELQLLYDAEQLPRNLQNVLRYFLFACYTGIRFCDVTALKFRNLVSDNDGYFIDFEQQKTKKAAFIPLIPPALALLPKMGLDNESLFDVKTNQTTNKKLKEIAQKAGIDKRLTFKVSRKTVNNNLLSLEVPVEVRSLIVGDTPEVLRAHYTKVGKQNMIEAMNRYSAALNDT